MGIVMQYVQSIIAALFGIQSDSKRREDFQKLSVKHLIALATLMTVALIILIVFVVNIVIG
ncbi:hypothetical protein OM33_01410 [Pseudoalteromonas piratica]|jgi:hypothetical protein|uniref:DUF2970 domain-containing protein n=2 Tax=Pseudoalteromonas piratica TaxID=1348114 RepID=A0A0A7EBS2_9GAMM|nr:hypothetical protein OM33_01410 [Pseudoalteromonas piratica]